MNFLPKIKHKKVLNPEQLLEDFGKVKVLIVGDVMLDRYYYGNVNRISPEAPVPIVNISETSSVVGGAANVALNVAGLGAEPILIGIIGNDYYGKVFTEVLENQHISARYLLTAKGRRTTVKTRIVAHKQHIVRLDQETTEKISPEQSEELWLKIKKLLPQINIIIISDYAKGTLTEGLLARIIKNSNKLKIKTLVDPKGKNYSIYKNASVLTPNKKEAAEACNFDEKLSELVNKAGEMLLSELELEALLITQGENGMTLFRNETIPTHLSAISRDVYDVTGAGDTVISTLAVALGAGAAIETAAEIANLAAGIVVEHFGTTSIDKSELLKAAKSYQFKEPAKTKS